MSFMSLILIAFCLSMDAFAVSITNGIIIKNVRLNDALKIGLYFGFFQALMPIMGWAAGIHFKDYIVAFDHWIAFVLLGFIGVKMIISALKEEKDRADEQDASQDERICENPLCAQYLLMLSVATSIDALAAGVSFAFFDIGIFASALLIGLITFTLSTFGVLIGKGCGGLLQKKAEIIGGSILTLMGVKILIEHTGVAVTVLKVVNNL